MPRFVWTSLHGTMTLTAVLKIENQQTGEVRDVEEIERTKTSVTARLDNGQTRFDLRSRRIWRLSPENWSPWALSPRSRAPQNP